MNLDLRALRLLYRVVTSPPEDDETPEDPIGESDAPPWPPPVDLPESIPDPGDVPPVDLPEPPECPSPEGLPVAALHHVAAAMRPELDRDVAEGSLLLAIIRAVQDYGGEVRGYPRIGTASITGPEDVRAILSAACGLVSTRLTVDALDAAMDALNRWQVFAAPE